VEVHLSRDCVRKGVPKPDEGVFMKAPAALVRDLARKTEDVCRMYGFVFAVRSSSTEPPVDPERIDGDEGLVAGVDTLQEGWDESERGGTAGRGSGGRAALGTIWA
jgi:hypothetical protein